MRVALSPDRFGGCQRKAGGRATVEACMQLIERWPLCDLTDLS
jgi:hypothetical protein